MKINPINSQKALKALGYTAACVALGAASYLTFKDLPDVFSRQKEENERNKEIVKKYNPSLYNDFMENGYQFNSWEIAAEQIQDSLRVDSIAKANYALGMQAMRDSLASANKK